MIDFSFEKELAQKNYCKMVKLSHYHTNWNDELERDIQHHWVYSKKNKECAMISLDHDVLNDKWALSYPIKGSKINYRILVNSKNEAIDHLKFILNQNALE
jgi:hypothetical protein